MSKSSARIATLGRWMQMQAQAGELATADQMLAWAKAMVEIATDIEKEGVPTTAAAPDPIIAYHGDRINAVESELIIDSIHKLVKCLSDHAVQAATIAELAEIDNVASAILDATTLLGRGVSRPTQPQNQTGA